MRLTDEFDIEADRPSIPSILLQAFVAIALSVATACAFGMIFAS